MSKTGFIPLSNLSLKEQSIPSITPTITDNTTERPINANVSIADSQRPTIPQYIKPNKISIPNFTPPYANEGIKSNATTNTQGDSSRKSSSMK